MPLKLANSKKPNSLIIPPGRCSTKGKGEAIVNPSWISLRKFRFAFYPLMNELGAGAVQAARFSVCPRLGAGCAHAHCC